MHKIPAIREFFKQYERTPFQWGEFDCCLMAAKWIEFQLGSTAYTDHKGKYDDIESAYKYLEQLGGYEEIIGSYLYKDVDNGYAQTGDVSLVICSKIRLQTLVVVFHDKVIMIGQKGLMLRGKDSVKFIKTWRVD